MRVFPFTPARLAPALLGAAGLGALAGCASSVRLDEPAPVVRAVPAPAAAAPVPAAPGPAAPAASVPGEPPVETFPVGPGGAAPAAPAAPAPVTMAPPAAAATESPAVEARFPAPGVQYDTPGLQPGREQFTSADELHGWLQSLADAARPRNAGAVRLLALGASQGGRPIEALLFSHEPAPDAATLLRAGRPTALLVGGQHGDEPAPAEALLVVARQLAQGRLNPLLDRINVIVLPRANPDGAAAGRRDNAAGVDVDRDQLALATPEAQALAALLREYQPAVVVDLHEYDPLVPWAAKFGAVPGADVLLQYASTPNLAPFVTRAAEEWFRAPLIDALAREQLRSDWYATTPDDPADRSVSMGSIVADTLRNVAGLRHAVGMLVESRGVGLGRHELQRRVHAQVTAASSLLASTAARAADLAKLRAYVEAEVSAQACQGEAVVTAARTHSEHSLLLLDPASGADKWRTVDWESALDLQPRITRPRPCGYWLAADAAPAVRRLREQGVQVRQLAENASAKGDEYGIATPGSAVTALKAAAGPLRHGGTPLVTIDALIDMPAGSYYVPLTQPLANLAIAALEPDAPASYVAAGVIADAAQVARVRVPPAGSFNDVP